MLKFVFLFVGSFLLPCDGLYKSYTRGRLNTVPVSGPNYGIPLILTDLLNDNKITEAQIASKVLPLKANVQSHSGYFRIDDKTNATMFFWYFPAEVNAESAPVAVWLQGGPGASSMFGLFEEHGPFYVKPQRGLNMRKYYWSQTLNVIYIDNPVGTGFSYANDESAYAKNEDDVGRDLYKVFQQFFKLFPHLQKNDFFVTGESYGGKYVPAAAYAIHKNNPKAEIKINLKGISIGNGLCDPINMLNYGDYLYQIGLVDSFSRQVFKQKEDAARSLIAAGKYEEAFDAFDQLLNGDLTPYKSYFYNVTNFNVYFNYLHNNDDSPFGDLSTYLAKDLVRRSIHVGNNTFHTDNKVEVNLKSDVMKSIAPWLQELLDNYRVLIYNGQLDIIVAYPLTVGYLQQLNWCGSKWYKTTTRQPWYVGKDLAGYYRYVAPSKCAGSLTEVLVRNAGHMVPQDQPKWALDLITRFAFNKPLS